MNCDSAEDYLQTAPNEKTDFFITDRYMLIIKLRCLIIFIGGLFVVYAAEKGELSRTEGDTLVVAEIVPESPPTNPPTPDDTNPTSSTESSKVIVDDGIVQTGDLQNIKIILWSLLLLSILLLVVFVRRSRNQ